MATYQTTYTNAPPKGLHGQIASEEKCNKINRTVENAGGVRFGQPVQRGAADHGVGPLAAGGEFLGISVLNPAVPADVLVPDSYPRHFTGAFMTMGAMYVTAGGAVSDGDEVYYNTLEWVDTLRLPPEAFRLIATRRLGEGDGMLTLPNTSAATTSTRRRPGSRSISNRCASSRMPPRTAAAAWSGIAGIRKFSASTCRCRAVSSSRARSPSWASRPASSPVPAVPNGACRVPPPTAMKSPRLNRRISHEGHQ